MTGPRGLAVLIVVAWCWIARASGQDEAALCETAGTCSKCARFVREGHQCVFVHGANGKTFREYGCVAGNASGPFNLTESMRRDTDLSFQFGFCCANGNANCSACISISPECRYQPRTRLCIARVVALSTPESTAFSSCDGCLAHQTCGSCLADSNCTYCLSSSTCVTANTSGVCYVSGQHCNCSHATCEECQQYPACMWQDYGAWKPRECLVKERAWSVPPLPTCDPAPLPCNVYRECRECIRPGCKWCSFMGAPRNFTSEFNLNPAAPHAYCVSDETPCPNLAPGLPLIGSHECTDCYVIRTGCRDCTSHDNSCVWCLDAARCSSGPSDGSCKVLGSELVIAPDTCPVIERCPNVGCSDCNLTPSCLYCHAEGRCKHKEMDCGGPRKRLFESCEEHCNQYNRSSPTERCSLRNGDSQCEFCAGAQSSGERCLPKPPAGTLSACLPDHLTLGKTCTLAGQCKDTICGGCIRSYCSFCPTTRQCARIVPRVGDTPAHRLEPCFGSYGVNGSCLPAGVCRAQTQTCSSCVATPGCLYAAETDECGYFELPSYEDGKWNNRCDTILDITLNYTATRYMFKGDAFYYRLAVEQPDIGAIHIDPHSHDVLLVATARAQRTILRSGDFSNENAESILTISEGAATISTAAYYITAICEAEQCVCQLAISIDVLTTATNASSLPSFLSFGLVGLVLVCVAGVAVRCVCRRRRRRAGGMIALLNDEDDDEIEPHGVIFQALIPPSRGHARSAPLTLDGGHGPRDAIAIIGPADVDDLTTCTGHTAGASPEALSSTQAAAEEESIDAPLLAPVEATGASTSSRLAAVARLEQLWLGVRVPNDEGAARASGSHEGSGRGVAEDLPYSGREIVAI